MQNCRKLIKALEKGHFAERFSELPVELKVHIDSCPECSRDYQELTQVEQRVIDGSKIQPSAQTLARIKAKTMQEIQGPCGRSRSYFDFLFVWPSFASAAIVLTIAIAIYNFPLSPISTPVFPQHDDEIQIGAYFDEWPVNIEVDDKLAAAIMFENSESLSAQEAWTDINFDDSYWVYTDESKSYLDQLNENDWNALRRYLS